MTTSTLKIIACISMLIDHIGAILFPQMIIFRIIGRIAFPIFAFLIVEGFYHTKSISKYLMRLGAFALISEFAFDRAFHGSWIEFSSQNVFFTLLIGLFAIVLYDHFKEENKVFAILFAIGCALVNEWIGADYGLFGILIIFGFYQYRGKNTAIFFWLLFLNSMALNFTSPITLFQLASLPLICVYNQKKGINLKYLFYAFYPVHLLILYFIQ